MHLASARPSCDDVLGPAFDWNYNACMPAQYSDKWNLYCEGFKMAADVLAEQAAENNAKAPLDCLILPVLHNYRHWIELELKLMVKQCYLYTHDCLPPEFWQRISTHRLDSLWGIACELLRSRLNIRRPNNSFLYIRDIIQSLSVTDPSSQEFRYPYDGAGNSHLTDLKLVNVRQLYERMQEFSEHLGPLHYQIAQRLEQ
jgi:hypothetical protein